ncbi:DUF4350 domain-containing protein [Nonomuraea roseoviolacea]|uniref:DUF4350 domain-containing protein n=1 Tax=Nonomuraea roseoviolacea subsp. carminata TaxID=160689 RepID=A0ABT1JVN3_9ACTN|nr:DUF4350 domain-containing protein [Nonomuraea roseoviolacea]MCP2345823.1 hypothetical protein [Nonomuraea roseoviolacea subsp. carminata]
MSLTGMGPAETRQSAPASPTARSMWRASRMAILLGLLVVAAAVVTVALGGGAAPSRRLDPDDTSLDGSRALAQLLRARGVSVDRADSVTRARELAKGGDRLLLVTDTSFVLDPAGVAAIPGDRVVVGDLYRLDLLAPGVRSSAQVGQRSREPECPLPAARAAGSAFMGGAAFTVPRGATGCYPAGDDGWTLVSLPNAGGTTTVVGDGAFMTNRRLAEDGNAALALDLLGTAKAVTWLVEPPEEDTVAGPAGQSVYDLMPPGVPWAVAMAAVAVLVTGLWRGRRLGPVVTERLPVVVRAAETVEGRGRLYRARRARGRAADVLRAGAIDRLLPRLGLAPDAGRDEVVAAVAARTGHAPGQVGAALYGPEPADDAGLVALAHYLDSIERTVGEH